MIELSGKSAIVTGAAHGIGLAIARRLVRAGASVMMADRDEGRLAVAAAALTAEGWDGDRLLPWVAHEKPRAAWAYSSLRVAQRLIARTAEPVSPVRQQELQRVLDQLPGHGRWSVVLALELTGDDWTGSALAGPEGKEVLKAWRYDPRLGLLPNHGK